MKKKLTPKEKNHYRTLETREIIPEFICNARGKEEYEDILTESVFKVMFKDGTEPAFSHPLHNNKEEGIYYCAACGQPLFGSEAKFDSGTGWPSFFAPLAPECVDFEEDYFLIMPRTAVMCSCCNGHLGHVFDDGPAPTFFRFCMNGTALNFKK
ncbi:MAG: peptide-methionine (R)-S-oxide reductase MsrB [Firmicutes bacterium]|nr:peptide-methionine (R)-S-oxide reductase MsrB [Bacillota bacterium]